MKPPSNITRKLTVATAILSVVVGAWTANAAEKMKPMKGAEHLLMLNQIQTTKDLNALQTDDTIAMVCAKCKTVWVTRVKQGVKGAQILNEHGTPTEIIGTHACAGCKDTITVVGHKKGDITELKHTCNACGGEVFCCATKPGAGTKGMEKK